MKHDNYKKAQPKAETKSDPPWETPIETMGVRFFKTMGVSFCFLTTNHRVFLKKLILYTHCEHTSYIIISYWKYCRNKGVPLCVKLCNYPVMDW